MTLGFSRQIFEINNSSSFSSSSSSSSSLPPPPFSISATSPGGFWPAFEINTSSFSSSPPFSSSSSSPSSSSGSTTLGGFWPAFEINNHISNFMKIRAVGAELLFADGRTDMTKLIVALRNYGNKA
jgi:hypothetical protein